MPDSRGPDQDPHHDFHRNVAWRTAREWQQRARQTAMVGREVTVLFEKPGRLPGQMVGKSEHLHAVHVPAPRGRPAPERGTLARVRITAAAPHSLAGELLG